MIENGCRIGAFEVRETEPHRIKTGNLPCPNKYLTQTWADQGPPVPAEFKLEWIRYDYTYRPNTYRYERVG